MSEHKDGRGDYYLAEGLRDERRASAGADPEPALDEATVMAATSALIVVFRSYCRQQFGYNPTEDEFRAMLRQATFIASHQPEPKDGCEAAVSAGADPEPMGRFSRSGWHRAECWSQWIVSLYLDEDGICVCDGLGAAARSESSGDMATTNTEASDEPRALPH